MDYSNFIVLLARQRSGTNAVRSILGTHREICCFNEIFAQPASVAYNEWLVNSNYFNFIARVAGGDANRLLPEHHRELFIAFLEHLRGLSTDRYMVIDVKYNSTHHVTQQYAPLAGPPFFLQLIMQLGLRTFVVTRRNYLRYILSNKKALKSGVYTVQALEDSQDEAVAIKPGELLFEMERCAAEDEMIDFWFTKYAKGWRRNYVGKYFRWDYADLFPSADQVISGEFLEAFTSWLEVENEFEPNVMYRKQSHLPLRASIEDFALVETTLRGTCFEYCLEDEPLYRGA